MSPKTLALMPKLAKYLRLWRLWRLCVSQEERLRGEREAILSGPWPSEISEIDAKRIRVDLISRRQQEIQDLRLTLWRAAAQLREEIGREHNFKNIPQP